MSVGRLQKFLTSEELHPDRITVADEPATGELREGRGGRGGVGEEEGGTGE